MVEHRDRGGESPRGRGRMEAAHAPAGGIGEQRPHGLPVHHPGHGGPAGGVPIEVDGAIVGAVGVSGVKAADDEVIALAGVNALKGALS